MKTLTIVLASIVITTLLACDGIALPTATTDAVDSITILRYDRLQARYLTTGDFSALQEMNTTYPMQTRALIEDVLALGAVDDVNINRTLLDYYQDSTLQALIYAAETEYANMDDITQELRQAFTKIRQMYPKADIPTFYAQISALNSSIVVDNNVIGISIDKYLGEDSPYYLPYFDAQQRQTMTREYLVPDIIVFYLLSSYGMADFARTTQHWQDINTAIVMYVTNDILDRQVFTTPFTQRIESYLAHHPNTTLKQLLEMTNYDEI